jgi:hypothetical protein
MTNNTRNGMSLIGLVENSEIITDKGQSYSELKETNSLSQYLKFSKPNLNPLAPEQVTDINRAKEISGEIVNLLLSNNDVFVANAKNLLAGCIWYLREEQSDKSNLQSVFSMIMGNSIEDLLQILKDNKESAQITEELYDGIIQGATIQIEGILAPLKNKISQIK